MPDLKTSQKISIPLFVIAMVAFFYFGSEMLKNHTNWNDFQTPAGVGEIFYLFASVFASIGAALGIDVSSLVRKFTGQNSRAEDK